MNFKCQIKILAKTTIKCCIHYLFIGSDAIDTRTREWIQYQLKEFDQNGPCFISLKTMDHQKCESSQPKKMKVADLVQYLSKLFPKIVFRSCKVVSPST